MGSPLSAGSIRIRKARQNNLAGIDVDVPRQRLVAITGLSGSGKSSLAFDTLFREGQRRFLETLSAYARQFLGRIEKPDVESIEGLSPAIAVDQRAGGRSPRSTVGTMTEIYDHLRVLFARAGRAHCPSCGEPLRAMTPEGIVQQVLVFAAGKPSTVLAPLVRDRKGVHRQLFVDLQKKGFVRARVNGAVVRLEEAPELERYKRHTIEVVVDRLKPDPADPGRLREAVEQALDAGSGDVVVLAGDEEHGFSTQRSCPGCGGELPPLEPRLFSFNSPHGACPTCEGLGELLQPSESRVVRDAALTLRGGALAVTRAKGDGLSYPKVTFRFLEQVAAKHGFDLDTPWRDLPAKARRAVLRGTGKERFADEASWNGARFQGSARWQRRYLGVLPALERAAAAQQKAALRFLATDVCSECAGSRLNAAARAVQLGGLGLAALVRLSVAELRAALDELALAPREQAIARDLLAEIRRRLDFLDHVGLGYLALERSAHTLSGGESQRIRLAAQLGSALQGVLYVLDEPSIGLHARDHGRLLGALAALRDAGNTVVVVEHDEATLRAADHIIDVGPGAGRHGGHVVAEGTPDEVARADSPTGRMLRGEIRMPAPCEHRAGNGDELWIRGASAHNLKDVDVRFPLGTLSVVAGVSGSGKSTLLNGILRPALLLHLGREAPDPLAHAAAQGLAHVADLVSIDAKPIGRTPRSNPATYTKVLGPIRDLFASLPEAKLRGFGKSRFSFNTSGGRCETCGGAGAQLVELQFLAPVTVPCDECGGQRFNPETLAVHFKGRSIAEVLAMTVDEALEFFADLPAIARPLAVMSEVGIGYLTLGQPSTTLSGGEAQRIKLATYLKKIPRGHTLFLLDEPTTGLHQEDVRRLVLALQQLVDHGHSVIVIEHNLDVVRAADWVVELGPEGGAAGGYLVAMGTPTELCAVAGSPTGAALAEQESARAARGARQRAARPAARRALAVAPPPSSIRVRGARTHNLQNVDVEVPRDALCVITGPSGSGKSSLALDTIFTEGRRRFVESLSTYARQFLGNRDRPPVDHIDGLGPTVAVEGGASGAHPRSTVATSTEILDHLRVLWARAGSPRCPQHAEKLEATSPSSAAKRASSAFAGARGFAVAALAGPGIASAPKAVAQRLAALRRDGFLRALVDGAELRLDGELPELSASSQVDLVVDRLSFGADTRARLAEALESAAALADGRMAVVALRAQGSERLVFSARGACPQCGFALAEKLEPRHFSFNTHSGACSACAGLGTRLACTRELLVGAPELALTEGAIGGKLGRYLTKGKGYYEHLLRAVAEAHAIPVDEPFERLSASQQDLLLHGRGARPSYEVTIEKSFRRAEIEERFTSDWPGLCGHVDAWHQKTEDPEWAALLAGVMQSSVCATCQGERLRADARAVVLGGKRLPELLAHNVEQTLAWLDKLRLGAALREAVEPVVQEVRGRLALLERVGLDYLTLDRPTQTLSGGEARRVRLAASLGSQLVGVCYVLDEPTVGLHPADVARLTDALCELRDRGNSVLVVEHDESLMWRADHVIDLGPGAGRHGGRVVAAGTPAEIAAHPSSKTGAALRGELRLVRDEAAAPASGDAVGIAGARLHNLKGVDFEARFGQLTGICGPSGSGKSTLVLECFVPAQKGEAPEGRWRRAVRPAGGALRVVVVDGSPIGRTPASVPATYAGVLGPMRELYARTPDARAHGFGPAHFSFNSVRGRCPACEGRGALKVEMQFLADLWLTCEECSGTRYRPEVLEARFRGKSIADALALSIDEAIEFFAAQPKIAQSLATLADVGLGYLALGQSSTTLSAGEAQRVKLAAELDLGASAARSVLVLDEPSTGLHASDVRHLAGVLVRLAGRGHAVILIEHHTGLLALCDELWELGPGGGRAGGEIVAHGTPRELAGDPRSITGPWIAPELEPAGLAPVLPRPRAARRATERQAPRRKGVAG